MTYTHTHHTTETSHLDESFVMSAQPSLEWGQGEIKTSWHTYTQLMQILFPGGNVQINICAANITTASSSWSSWCSLLNHHQMTEYIKLPSTSISPQLDPHRLHHFLMFPTMAALSNITQPCAVPGTSATTKDMAATWPPSPSRSRLQYRPSPATCMDQAGEVSDLHERVKSGHGLFMFSIKIQPLIWHHRYFMIFIYLVFNHPFCGVKFGPYPNGTTECGMFSHLVFVWRLFPDTWGHACTPQPSFIPCIPIQTIPQVSTLTNCSNIQGTRCRSAETNRRPTEEWQWRFLWGSRRPSKYLIGSNLIEIPGPAGWHELKSWAICSGKFCQLQFSLNPPGTVDTERAKFEMEVLER